MSRPRPSTGAPWISGAERGTIIDGRFLALSLQGRDLRLEGPDLALQHHHAGSLGHEILGHPAQRGSKPIGVGFGLGHLAASLACMRGAAQ
jgi:hypothetical protein